MALKEFIEEIKRSTTIEEIIGKYDNQRTKGYVYERLWDIMIKFGHCEKFPKSKYDNMIGNVNNGMIKEMKSMKKYVEQSTIDAEPIVDDERIKLLLSQTDVK